MLTSYSDVTYVVVWKGGRAEASEKGGEIEGKQCAPPASDMTRVIELQSKLLK